MSDSTKSSVAKEKGRRTISPYDLTAGDNPGTLISKPLLKGPNFDEWSLNLKLALEARKKFGFADGTIPQPDETSSDYEDWTANNALVVSWMKLTIDENVSTSMSHIVEAHELWTHIQKRFGVKNGQRVQRLKAELANCRQKGLAIDAYYGKLTSLWRGLANYQKAKTMEEVRKEREEDKLHQFLMGLDESTYGAVKSSLLSRVPLPSIVEAYNTLTQDEESKNLGRMNEDKTDGVSFAVQTISASRAQPGNRGGSFTCTHCGRSGHLAENCFRLIGYTPWWEDKQKNKSSSVRGSTFAGNTFTRGQQPSVASSTKGGSHASHHVSAHHRGYFSGHTSALSSPAALTDADRVGISGLSDTQWKTLV